MAFTTIDRLIHDVDNARSVYRTPQNISRAVCESWHRRDPTIDLEPGSVFRKIVDALSGAVSATTMDSHLNVISYEIDGKSGEKLDKFVGLFGFQRKSAQLARGTVRMYASQGSSLMDFSIPRGIRVTSPGNLDRGDLHYRTIVSAVLGVGDTHVDVSVQSELPGTLYNVQAGEVSTVSQGVAGVSIECSNLVAMDGASDQEDDVSLRERFKKTLFRGIAGTVDAFVGTALANDLINRCEVYSQVNRFKEQIQLENISGIWRATLSKQDAVFGTDFVYTVDNSIVAGNGDKYYRRHTDYVINKNGRESWIERRSGSLIPDSAHIIVDYDYIPEVSRAKLTDTGKNTVDIFMDGSDPKNGTDRVVKTNIHPSPAPNTYDADDELGDYVAPADTDIHLLGEVEKWAPAGTGLIEEDTFTYTGRDLVANTLTGVYGVGSSHDKYASVVETNARVYHTLMNQPVIELPGAVTDQDGVIYQEGIHYDLVKDDSDTLTGESWSATDRLVWRNAASIPGGSSPAAPPVNGKWFWIQNYQWDRMPITLQDLYNKINLRTIGQDVMVHKSIRVYLHLYIAVMYSPNASINSADEMIEDALARYANAALHGSYIQISDIAAAIRSVPLVDNARFITSVEDVDEYGIQVEDQDGNSSRHRDNQFYIEDFLLEDNEIPVINAVSIVRKSQNTFFG